MQIQHFEDLPLGPEVMKGIEELGFSNLFPIQAQAIIPLLEGKDVIGQAQTGTGKTAAFVQFQVHDLFQRPQHLLQSVRYARQIIPLPHKQKIVELPVAFVDCALHRWHAQDVDRGIKFTTVSLT